MTRSITNSWRSMTALLVAVVVVLASGTAFPADSTKQASPFTDHHVLLLHSYSEGFAAHEEIVSGFIAGIVERGGNIGDLYTEKLDLIRFNDPAYRRALADLLRVKFANKKIDLIVSLQMPALDFVLNEGRQEFGDTPVIAGFVHRDLVSRPLPSHVVLLPYEVDFKGTLDRAVELFPETRRVVLVGGGNPTDQVFMRQARRAFALYTNRLEFEYLDDGDYEAMLARVSSLPADSIVIIATYYQDKNGRVMRSRDPHKEVRRLANAPVFSLWDSILKTGIMGGSVISIPAYAKQASLAAADFLSGKVKLHQLGDLPLVPGQPMFNWPEIERWKGNDDRLPADSIFFDRPRTLWGEYRSTVIGATAFFLVLVALVAGLSVTLRRLLAAKRMLLASSSYTRSLIEASPDPLMVLNAEGTITDVNLSTEKALGLMRWQLVGSAFANYFSEQDRAISTYRTVWGGEAVIDAPLSMRRTDGNIYEVLCNASLYRDAFGSAAGVFVVVRDVTERNKTERELESYREQLEVLVQERTRALAVALEQAESASRAKSAFLSNMSHELRTPLNAVIGFSRMMARSQHLDDKDRRNLDIINSSGNHLLTLINDVLELSKIEAGRAELMESETDLGGLLDDVVKMLKPRADQAGIALELRTHGLPKGVRVDTMKLRQALINLVTNAIKFTPAGRVVLEATGSPAGEGHIKLEVSITDTGIGIAAADQKRIFEPFVQLVTHATAAGTGLGLPITRQYLQMLGSELRLQSEPGKGSTFGFALNLQEAAHAVTVAPEIGVVAGLAAKDQGKRILIAEDNEDSRNLLIQLLEPLGFSLMEAVNGEEAVDKAMHSNPDLILMDWRMPKMNGLEATRRIRSSDQTQGIKIVMLTASAFEEERNEALLAGIDDFLSKPLDDKQLFAVLESCLGINFSRVADTASLQPDVVLQVTPEEIASLPADIRVALRQAIEELNRTKLNEVLAQIAPIMPSLAQGMAQMLEGFHYERLWKIIAESSDARPSA